MAMEALFKSGPWGAGIVVSGVLSAYLYFGREMNQFDALIGLISGLVIGLIVLIISSFLVKLKKIESISKKVQRLIARDPESKAWIKLLETSYWTFLMCSFTMFLFGLNVPRWLLRGETLNANFTQIVIAIGFFLFAILIRKMLRGKTIRRPPGRPVPRGYEPPLPPPPAPAKPDLYLAVSTTRRSSPKSNPGPK